MTNYRRVRVAGGRYFFTVALADRGSDILVSRVELLRRAFARTMEERPFRIDAIVVLPDHLHTVWTLPNGDSDFSTRWRLVKTRFSKEIGFAQYRSWSKAKKNERGIWQRRFWEHAIRDEGDYSLHLRYCWGNPVKHGLVSRPRDWPYSSFHRDARQGRIDVHWVGESPDGAFGE